MTRMLTDDYLADYARLGLQPGCSVETLERTWRLAVRDLHPDRASDRADAETRSRQLHLLTAAYRRLRQFEREHGRLPGGVLRAARAGAEASASQVPPPAAWDAGNLSGSAEARLPSGPRRRSGVAAMLAATGVAVLLWAGTREVLQEPSVVPDAGTQSMGHPGAGLATPAVRMPQPMRRIRVGSTEAQVERLMGTPPISDIDLWEYGPSHVRFHRGRVVGWYSSPLKPLPVDVESR